MSWVQILPSRPTIGETMFKKARAFAVKKHGNQKRKYTDRPYVEHCFAVSNMLIVLGYASEVVTAGMLHDVLEDTDTTYEELCEEFGKEVADLVKSVTKISTLKDGNRAERKELDIIHYTQAPPEGQAIKLADIIDNVPDIVKHNPKFGSIYVEEAYDFLQRIYLTLGNMEIFGIAYTIVSVYRGVIDDIVEEEVCCKDTTKQWK